MEGAVPGVQRVCEDVQTADHSGGVTSCKRTPETAENHQLNEHHRDTERDTVILPNREILCLTRAASLQNRLEQSGRKWRRQWEEEETEA